MAQKKILILGAGLLQSFAIKRAKELGYYTLAIDKNPKSVGFSYVDQYEVIDIVDMESCLDYSIKNKIDGVLTVATDYGVISASYIAQEMNLPCIPTAVAKAIKDKYKVRTILYENNIDDISQFYRINDICDLKKIKDQVRFPLMVKPIDGSGSKGAARVENIEELEAASKIAIRESSSNTALLEDFIEGKEYGVESFVFNGKIYVLGILGKKMTDPPNYAELGHFMPSKLDMEPRIKDIVKRAIKALNIGFGAVNMDILIGKNKEVNIVDIGARMGGNLIGSHIIPIGTGIDYMDNIIRAAAGDDVDLTPKRPIGKVITRILALTPGKIRHIGDIKSIENKYNVKIFHNLGVGNVIKKYRNNTDGCGYILATTKDLEEAKDRMLNCKDEIDKSIIRE